MKISPAFTVHGGRQRRAVRVAGRHDRRRHELCLARGRGRRQERRLRRRDAQSQAAGKLVATNRSGADKGRLPGKFVADVAEDERVQQGLRGRRQRARRPAVADDDQGPRHDDGDLQRPGRRGRQRGPVSIVSSSKSGEPVTAAASATATARLR